MKDDLYKILGVAKDATKEQLKRAYKRMCSKVHPDRAPDEEREARTEQQAKVNMAYKLLTNDDTRQRYDAGEDVEQPVDNTTAAAYQVLAETFHGCVMQSREPRDFLIEMRQLVAQEVLAQEGEVLACTALVAQYERLLGILKRKDQGINPFQVLLDAQVSEHRLLLTRLQRQVLEVRRALELLDSFESGYVPPPPPPPPPAPTFHDQFQQFARIEFSRHGGDQFRALFKNYDSF